MKRLHYSWVICAVCTLVLFCTVGLSSSAFSVHQPYIISVNGFTNAQASTILTVRYIAGITSMLFVDKIVAKLGAKKCAVIALLLDAAGFAIYGMAKNGVTYYVGAVFVGLSQTLGGMVLASIIIANWFRSNKALAISICSAGSGIASVLCPAVVTPIIEATSLSTAFFVESAFMVCSAVIVIFLLVNTPREKGMEPYANGRQEKIQAKTYGSDPARGVFAMLCVSIFLLGGVMNVDTSYMSTLYRGVGHDSTTVSLILSLCGIMLIVGKLLYGACVDRIGGYRANYVFIALLLAGQILHCLAATGVIAVALAAQVLLGIGLPVATVGVTVTATSFSTEKTFAKHLRILQFTLTAGSLALSPLPGIMADHAGGSYLSVFKLCVVMTLIYGVVIQGAYIFNKKLSSHKGGDSPNH